MATSPPCGWGCGRCENAAWAWCGGTRVRRIGAGAGMSGDLPLAAGIPRSVDAKPAVPIPGRLAVMRPVFTDAAVEPDAETIRAVLGPAFPSWDALNDLFVSAGADVNWRHYRDGGWLAKVTQRAKTVAWMSIEDGLTQVSFHFAERYRSSLLQSEGLPPELREQITHAPLAGRLFSVSLGVRTLDEVSHAGTLLALKLAAR
jgi:hypothetical protein